MGYDSYSLINSLEETVFIGGNYYIMNFEVFDENNSPLDLNAATVKGVLAPYGDPDMTILSKTGSITGTNTFKVVFENADTLSLSGKYIFQPVITDFQGKQYRPGQGIVLINPAIPVT